MRSLLLLTAVAIVAGAAAAFGDFASNFTSPLAPTPGGGVPATLQMKGVTGSLKGGDIALLGVHLDYTNGCVGVEFRKATDNATPQFFAGRAAGSVYPTAMIQEYNRTPRGITKGLTLKLSGISLVGVHHVDATTTGAYDDVSTRDAQIKVTWPGGASSTFACYQP